MMVLEAGKNTYRWRGLLELFNSEGPDIADTDCSGSKQVHNNVLSTENVKNCRNGRLLIE